MTIQIQAVLPKKKLSPEALQAEATRWLKEFAAVVLSDMQKYPPQQPTTYVRTGNYGRSWRTRYSPTFVDIYNNVSYAVWVGGRKDRYPGQARIMAGKGWISISTVAAEARKAELPKWSRVVWR